MDRLRPAQRKALICRLVKAMGEVESWAGETHIQKTVMFLQELLQVPLGYRFILYKYGPFSFDLRKELASMRAGLMLDVEPNMNYGPSFSLGIRGTLAVDRSNEFQEAIEFINERVSSYDVRTLERLSTAFYVRNREPDLNESQVAARVNELKPHIPVSLAREALEQVGALTQSARQRGLIT